MIAVFAVVITVGIFVALPWFDTVSRVLSPDGRRVLEMADSIELVGLNPLLNERSWEVGKVVITDPVIRKTILDRLFDDIRNGDDPAMCFNPHHLIRASHEGKETELIICFRCSLIKTRAGNRVKWAPIARSSEKYLDQILFDSGVWNKLPEYDEEEQRDQ